MNWNTGTAKYLQYSGNSYGDNVTFDDTLFTASDANITLNSPVVPASVIFNNSSTPYSITGSGGIGGATSLTVSGSGTVFLGTSNSFSGGTVINAGTVVVTNDNALGTSSGVVTLAGGTLQFSNSTASVRAISVTANSTIDVATNATVQLSNNISGSGGLTMTDNGTLTLSGSSISLGGRLTVEAGLMNVDGGTLGAASIHMITLSSGSSTGTLNINGSTVNNSAETVVCDGQNAGTSGQGTLNVNSGSILNSEVDLLISFAGSGIGQVNIATGATATPTASAFCACGMNTTGTTMYIAGGTSNYPGNVGNNSSHSLVFNSNSSPTSAVWTTLGTISQAVFGASGCIVGSDFYIFGGKNGTNYYSAIQYYNGSSWATMDPLSGSV